MKTLEHSPTASAAADNDSPYLSARREWNERYGDYIAQARNWRRAAFAAIQKGAELLESDALPVNGSPSARVIAAAGLAPALYPCGQASENAFISPGLPAL